MVAVGDAQVVTDVDVGDLVEAVGSIEQGCRDRARLTAAMSASSRLRAWLDGRDVLLATQLAQVAGAADQVIAEATRTSVRAAGQLLDRARTAAAIPALGDALAAGAVSGAHVDVVGRALRQLEPAERTALVADGARWLVATAERSTPDGLRASLAAEVQELRAADGMATLERQRRACRLRHGVDDDGMWYLAGRFDPETGLRLDRRLATMVDTLFAERVPEHAPADPRERQAYLRACALVALTDGGAPGAGRPEVVVVVDTTAAESGGVPSIDWGLPVELPQEVLQELFGEADVVPVVVRGGTVLYSPGCLQLGRSTRLASVAQRRVLRGLYPTCAIPGCDVRFDRCKIHHVVWWEHGGATDLGNLLPVCVQHHHAIHDRGWSLDLRADRTLTITYPDGERRTTGPPSRERPHRPLTPLRC